MSFNHPVKSEDGKTLIRWVVQKTSTLHINGKTNVSSFGCAISGYYQTDTISYSEGTSAGKNIPLSGHLDIAIQDFNCHNKGLTNDLRKTLKSGKYPYLLIQFIALERLPNLTGGNDKVKGWIDVAMAGVTKRFEIMFTLDKNQTTIHLSGSRAFSFSQFELVPPQKMGGMIKVKDSFLVDFSLVLRQL